MISFPTFSNRPSSQICLEGKITFDFCMWNEQTSNEYFQFPYQGHFDLEFDFSKAETPTKDSQDASPITTSDFRFFLTFLFSINEKKFWRGPGPGGLDDVVNITRGMPYIPPFFNNF